MKKKLYIVILLFNLVVYSQDTIRQFDPNNSNKLILEYVVDNETKEPNGFFKEFDNNGILNTYTEYKNGLLWNIFVIKDLNNNLISKFKL